MFNIRQLLKSPLECDGYANQRETASIAQARKNGSQFFDFFWPIGCDSLPQPNQARVEGTTSPLRKKRGGDFMNKSKTNYLVHRIKLEKLKHKIWQLVVIAKLLDFLVQMLSQ